MKCKQSVSYVPVEIKDEHGNTVTMMQKSIIIAPVSDYKYIGAIVGIAACIMASVAVILITIF